VRRGAPRPAPGYNLHARGASPPLSASLASPRPRPRPAPVSPHPGLAPPRPRPAPASPRLGSLRLGLGPPRSRPASPPPQAHPRLLRRRRRAAAAAASPRRRRRHRTARGVSHPPAPVWGRGVSVRGSRSSGCPSHRNAALAPVKQTAPCTPLRQQSDPKSREAGSGCPAALLWPTYQQRCRLFSRAPPGKIFFAARRLISARRRRGIFPGRL